MVVNSLPVMLKKDFLLKDENAAAKFESALNVIYPFEDSDKGQIKHMKKGNSGYSSGQVFDNYNAMIITVDPKGAITKITYNLVIRCKPEQLGLINSFYQVAAFDFIGPGMSLFPYNTFP